MTLLINFMYVVRRMGNNFYRNHLAIPLVVFIVVVLSVELSSIDLSIASQIYQAGGEQWLWKDNWLLSTILHTKGRESMLFLLLLVLVCWLLSFKWQLLKSYRSSLSYILIGIIFSVLSVSFLKQVTGVDCPWSLSMYGGSEAYYPLFSTLPADMDPGGCFPAGHASAGYAWFVLYFVMLFRKPEWRWYALMFPLLVGGVFGITQQLRGAHFISHDMWTMGICWFYAALFAPIQQDRFWRQQYQRWKSR